MKILITILLCMLLGNTPQADKSVKFDKKVHDFGVVSTKDKNLSCVFTLTNDTKEEINIFAVISSCGCTEVTWTREAIPAGGQGTIKATYANEDGPYPFDKTLTVYTSAQKKPVILHIKGVVKNNGTD